jgi:hypothetical protein
MINTILQVLIFVLLTLFSLFAFGILLGLAEYLLGVLLGIWIRIRKDNTNQFFVRYSGAIKFISIGITIPMLLYIGGVFRFNWSLDWLKIWESPLTLGLLFLSSIFLISLQKSDNPLIRDTARGIKAGVWPVFFVLLLGFFAPTSIRLESLRFAVLVSALLIVILRLLLLRYNTRNFQLYEEIEARRQSLNRPLMQLHKIANLIGDVEKWGIIRQIIDDVDNKTSKAHIALQRRKFQDADAYIIQAEMEVSQIERVFQDRLRLSLQDELRARLRQSSTDIITLKEEFKNTGLDAASINQIADEIGRLETKLGELDIPNRGVFTEAGLDVVPSDQTKLLAFRLSESRISDENLLRQLEPFERLFKEIIDLRTALRFRQNFGSAIDSLYANLDAARLPVRVAQNLDLNTTEVENRINELSSTLQEFQSKPGQTSNDLVDAYRSVQNALTSLQESVALLKVAIQRGWDSKIFDDIQLLVYVPRIISTSRTARGLVLLQYNKPISEKVNFVLSGTLLELQSDLRTNGLSLICDNELHSINYFVIAGKKGGKATLTLKSENVKNSRFQESFNIRVQPTLVTIAQEALLFGTLGGGVIVGLILLALGVDLKDASSLATVIGGLIGAIFFGINYLRFHRFS